jgi:integrase
MSTIAKGVGGMSRLKFTARTIAAIKPPVTGQLDYFDARLPGFGLRVSPSGHKSWVALFRHRGRVRRLTLGAYPALTLAEARTKAKSAFHAVAQGEDPAAQKRSEYKAESFGELADQYMERHAKLTKRSWREDERILKHDVLSRWARTKAKAIARRDVRELLEAIVDRDAPIQANRTFALVRKIFNFAIQMDIVSANPCQALSRPAPERQRDRVLSLPEIGGLFMALTRESPCIEVLFKLHLLTAQREGELMSMRWENLDLEGRWWTIPATRAKNGRAHRVPLSGHAVALIRRLERDEAGSPWVFPSTRIDGHITTMRKSVARVRELAGIDFAPHDLRRTAASHMTALGISRLTVAKILNHAERGVTAVYDRYSYDQEKRQALELWSRKLEGIPAQMMVPTLTRVA